MRVTVVVRTLNSETTLEHCLSSVRGQTVPCGLVVVDSGSTDSSLAIAALYDAEVVTLGNRAYTPGVSLNLGLAATGSADLAVILSSHCWLPDEHFVERAIAHFRANTGLAAAYGDFHGADGRLLHRPVRIADWPVAHNVMWGFSNHASVVSVPVWQELPFDEALDACEDKAWEADLHRKGLALLVSPDLVVTTTHRRKEGLRKAYRRARLEGIRCSEIAATPGGSVRAYLRYEWTLRSTRHPYLGLLRVLRPSNMVKTVAVVLGLRAGRRP